MLKLTKQNQLPITYRGLGDATSTLVDFAKQQAQAVFQRLQNRNGNRWIDAQNQAARELSEIVSAYVAYKNAGNLNPNYINNAIARTTAVTDGFAIYASQFGESGAARGASEISANGNAMITNMRFDLSQLPSGYFPTGITDFVSDNSALLLGGAFVILILPKLLKGR